MSGQSASVVTRSTPNSASEPQASARTDSSTSSARRNASASRCFGEPGAQVAAVVEGLSASPRSSRGHDERSRGSRPRPPRRARGSVRPSPPGIACTSAPRRVRPTEVRDRDDRHVGRRASAGAADPDGASEAGASAWRRFVVRRRRPSVRRGAWRPPGPAWAKPKHPGGRATTPPNPTPMPMRSAPTRRRGEPRRASPRGPGALGL